MSEHPNAVIARESYDAIAKGDFDHLSGDLLADDVVFHVPGRGPLAGDYHGKDEVVRYLSQLSAMTQSTLRFEPEAVLANEDRAAVILRAQGERGGQEMNDHGVHVFRIDNGKISERWSFPHDTYAVDAFFA